ncbi:hypothetical protein NDU88_003539 [Pleurodeles waltl]|uniref:Uncharacterized protein n=1 Tax=Pleurodeles waltl TaxID=8319 RepID=A0AAV7KYS7_PLEWA|nr:hypothetical protein NDU88_003539 [Pleurodeles waltl]
MEEVGISAVAPRTVHRCSVVDPIEPMRSEVRPVKESSSELDDLQLALTRLPLGRTSVMYSVVFTAGAPVPSTRAL